MAAKQKKKRNKRYSGVDAKIQTTSVTRVSAEERSRFREWWLVYGKLARLVAVAFGVLFIIILLVIGIIGIF